VDLTRFWHVKMEGHFIEGYGSRYSFRGFYPSTNPQGLQDRTKVLLMRTGVSF
jgi:hypothetical protein